MAHAPYMPLSLNNIARLMLGNQMIPRDEETTMAKRKNTAPKTRAAPKRTPQQTLVSQFEVLTSLKEDIEDLEANMQRQRDSRDKTHAAIKELINTLGFRKDDVVRISDTMIVTITDDSGSWEEFEVKNLETYEPPQEASSE